MKLLMCSVKMCTKIAFFMIICLIFQTGSSLLCADNSAKGIATCTNGDICFRHVNNVTKQVTKGCNSPAVCENIEDGSKCTTCDTDLCNSAGNELRPYIIFTGILVIFNILSKC